jgi:hypothetical protein
MLKKLNKRGVAEIVTFVFWGSVMLAGFITMAKVNANKNGTPDTCETCPKSGGRGTR